MSGKVFAGGGGGGGKVKFHGYWVSNLFLKEDNSTGMYQIILKYWELEALFIRTRREE